MAKFNVRIVAKICDLISSDSYTIAELCTAVGIDPATYHRWIAEKPEFSQAVGDANRRFDELLVTEAKRSLMKKIKGYSEDEITTVYLPSKKDHSKPEIKERKVVKKHFQPDTASVIFTLTNKAPDEYRHRQTLDAKVDMATKVGELSDEQLDVLIQKVLENGNTNSVSN
jgi:hypothetical protein